MATLSNLSYGLGSVQWQDLPAREPGAEHVGASLKHWHADSHVPERASVALQHGISHRCSGETVFDATSMQDAPSHT